MACVGSGESLSLSLLTFVCSLWLGVVEVLRSEGVELEFGVSRGTRDGDTDIDFRFAAGQVS